MTDNIEIVDPMEEFLSDETGVEETVPPTDADDDVVPEVETDTDVDPDAETTGEVEAEVAADEPAEPETTPEPAKAVPDPVEAAGLMAALIAERSKRQELEKQMAATVKEPTKFDWDNPEESIEAVKHELRLENQNNLLNLSEAGAKARYDDYDAKYGVFVEMAKENPVLVQTMLTKPDPAEYVYQLAKERIFHDEVGSDPKTYEDKLRAQVRLEIEAEMNAKASGHKALANSLPPSANSLTDKNTPVETTKDPYEDLFPGQHRS